MVKKNIVFASVISMIAFSSCSDFMDSYPYGAFPEEEFWDRPNVVQGLVYKPYDYMSKNYDNNEGYYLDGATDDAVVTSTTHKMTRYGTGAITTSEDPFEEYWKNDYMAIASVNRFLKDDKGLNTRFMINEEKNAILSKKLHGEAYALRAWFEWDLLKRFGGRTEDGKLMGFPIVTESFDDMIYTKDFNMPRNTYKACVEQIVKDCEKAYEYLPIAHRDFIAKANGWPLDVAGGKFWGCLDGISTRAILSQVYLTYASPLFNEENDRELWKKAAEYAKEVMDFKQTVDNVKDGFVAKNYVNWTNPNFAGIVFSSRFASSDAMEKSFYPAGFRGNGNIGASQELVDAFPMSNGYPKEHPEGAKLYDPQDPYKNRDPRFYSIIFYNGAKAYRDNNVNKPMYTFENWAHDESEDGLPGKDLAGNNKTSRTNYHIKKFVYMGFNQNDATVKRANHSKFYIRWAHMVLNFAEAANEYGGPDYEIDGLTAREAMKLLRTRNTYDNKELFNNDPYLEEVANYGKDAFREFVRNERRIETCFEGMRYYDLRRWCKNDTDLSLLNRDITRPVITKKVDGTFFYDEPEVVEKRHFESPYQPIPYNEMRKMDKLEQNKGWEKWK